jgi:rSAM/selenodomain-associated transferase 2
MADEQSAITPARSATISIVVPVLNEAPLIRSFLAETRRCAPGAEIIVADGGSSDGTAEIAAGFCDRVVRSAQGRAVQMNAGAHEARGEVLWFLHADVQIPEHCLESIRRIMDDPRTAGGFFRVRLPVSGPVYRLTDGFAHYAGIILRMRCGDHGIFCRREIFAQAGGFPEVPLMEDVELFRKVRRCGRIVTINDRLIASPRRYQEVGPWRVTLGFGLIAALYSLGVRLSFLEKLYRRICCREK